MIFRKLNSVLQGCHLLLSSLQTSNSSVEKGEQTRAPRAPFAVLARCTRPGDSVLLLSSLFFVCLLFLVLFIVDQCSYWKVCHPLLMERAQVTTHEDKR